MRVCAVGNTFVFLCYITGHGPSTFERVTRHTSAGVEEKSVARLMHSSSRITDDTSTTWRMLRQMSDRGPGKPPEKLSRMHSDMDQADMDIMSVFEELSCSEDSERPKAL